MIIHPDGEKYFLKFEIRQYDEKIALFEEDNSVGNNGQNMRTWIRVPSAETQNVQVCEMKDSIGKFYVSDTRYYVPIWLRAELAENSPHNSSCQSLNATDLHSISMNLTELNISWLNNNNNAKTTEKNSVILADSDDNFSVTDIDINNLYHKSTLHSNKDAQNVMGHVEQTKFRKLGRLAIGTNKHLVADVNLCGARKNTATNKDQEDNHIAQLADNNTGSRMLAANIESRGDGPSSVP